MKAYTTRVGHGPFPTELTDAVGESLRKIGALLLCLSHAWYFDPPLTIPMLGHEFGTTTGRPRRCGWADLPMMRYVQMVNNFKYINLTKLDVLSELKEIKVAVNYRIDGKVVPSFPASLEDLSRVEVEYKTLPGWQCDISKARKLSDLPEALRRFDSFLSLSLSSPLTCENLENQCPKVRQVLGRRPSSAIQVDRRRCWSRGHDLALSIDDGILCVFLSCAVISNNKTKNKIYLCTSFVEQTNKH